MNNRPAIHPGQILTDELAELGITMTALARQIEVPQRRISRIVRGERPIDGDMALRLGHWFNNSAQFWLNLQSNYDLRVASAKAGDNIARLPRRMA